VDKLRAIALFCRTVEAKSFAAAAQRLDVVPSALSKAIAALERDLGFSLMHRSTRKLSLTDEGAVYYEQCRQLLQGLEDAEAGARRGRARAGGTLRIGLHPALRFWTLARLAGFLDAHPDLKMETTITNSPAAILDEGLDIVLRIGKASDSSLVARQLGWASSVVCASPAYISAWGEPGSPDDLTRHRAIVYGRRDEEPNIRWEFTKGRERRTIEMPIRLIMRDGVGIADAAIGGCGVARPFAFAVQALLDDGKLQALLEDWKSERQPLYALLPPKTRGVPAKVRAYLEFFESALSTAGVSK
jgi:LysR family transcriptional regulator, regulator for bpeEF and oprC